MVAATWWAQKSRATRCGKISFTGSTGVGKSIAWDRAAIEAGVFVLNAVADICEMSGFIRRIGGFLNLILI